MKLHSGLDAKQLLPMLVDALCKEQEQWIPQSYKQICISEVVCRADRDKTVHWLLFLSGKFQFTPETVALSITLLDKFLFHVKVRTKYLQCVGITCLYLASKALEEDELIPTTTELIRQSQCYCSVSEISRMEVTILNKLGWNIKYFTAVDFLHIVHALLTVHHPHLLHSASHTPSHHLSVLTGNAYRCMSRSETLMFRPVTLVLAIVTLELERISKPWIPVAVTFQKLAEIDSGDLIKCRELVCKILFNNNPALSHAEEVRASRANKRKVDDLQTDDIYDSIKKLYNEDSTSLIRSTSSCGSQLLQDPETFSQCQTVSAT